MGTRNSAENIVEYDDKIDNDQTTMLINRSKFKRITAISDLSDYYEYERKNDKIGQGGQASVFKVKRKTDKNLFAMKLIEKSKMQKKK